MPSLVEMNAACASLRRAPVEPAPSRRGAMRRLLPAALLLLAACGSGGKPAGESLPPRRVVPTAAQAAYQEMELVGFIHFGMNTFTGREWGYGDDPPGTFAPERVDAEQWARVARAAGMKELILTAKHHDGFCLWPTAATGHSVRNSPYRNGGGDVVAEFVAACRKHGIRAGLYLSPWDRNHAAYGTPAYIGFYKAQLRELLTRYGRIDELWFDGANGGDGYYGGARETRRIDARTYYPWREIWAEVRRLQPGAVIFSDAGPDLRWCGNERGSAGDPFWSTIDANRLVIGRSDTAYLNRGDPEGKEWLTGVCDVSIRPGWFHHAGEDGRVKTPKELVEIWYESVGRNAVLLLNLPPGPDGRIQEPDVRALQGFRRALDDTFQVDLASGGRATASSQWRPGARFAPANVLDGSDQTVWAAASREASIEIALPAAREFDRVVLQEPIRLGQRIAAFSVQVFGDGTWQTIATGTTVGYKRALRVPLLRSDRVRLLVGASCGTPAVSEFSLYRSSPLERAE